MSKKIYKCMDCGKEIHHQSKRCGRCSKKHSNPNEFKKAEKNPRWKGGKQKTSQGYIYQCCPDHPYCNKKGFIMQHRLVVEDHIGRYLKPSEVVHHKNGKKNDNRINNLELFNSNIEHLQFHGIIGPIKKSLRKRNILFLLPLYGAVPACSAFSFLNLMVDAMEYYNPNFIGQLDMYTPLARTRLAYQAINIYEADNNLDAVIFLDQDQVYQSCDFINLIERFCESDYDCLSAVYYYKDLTKRPVIFNFSEEGDLEFVDDLKLNQGIIKVDGCGLGFCAMKPEFLKKMHKEYNGLEFMTETRDDKKFVGEDVAFFKKAKKIGAKVMVDTSIKIGHYGAIV